MTSLKEMVSGKVRFAFYKDGELWYRTDVGGFEFPVPIGDAGTAVFMAEDKGLFFMRWLRKHLSQQESWRAHSE